MDFLKRDAGVEKDLLKLAIFEKDGRLMTQEQINANHRQNGQRHHGGRSQPRRPSALFAFLLHRMYSQGVDINFDREGNAVTSLCSINLLYRGKTKRSISLPGL